MFGALAGVILFVSGQTIVSGFERSKTYRDLPDLEARSVPVEEAIPERVPDPV